MNKRLKYTLIIIAILLIIGLVLLIRSRGTVSVVNIEIENKKVIKTVSSSGIIKSKASANLAFPSTGKITSITVEKGDEISRGKSLAALFAMTQSQTSQAAKDARDIAIRNKEIYIEDNEGADYSSDEYQLQIRKHNELISQAEANYQATLGSLRNLYITAPFNGTVLDVYKEVGEVATAGSTLIKIADLNQLYFEVELDQEDFGQIRVGQMAKIELDAYEDIKFAAEVISLPTYAQTDSTGSETFVVEIAVTSLESHPILLNMTGDANIVVQETLEDVQTISFDQLNVDGDDQEFLWEFLDGKLLKLPIQIGIEGDLLTEVQTDLLGKSIVAPTSVNGKKIAIEDGTKAKVVNK